MYIDSELMVSEGQAITAAARSTNVLDLGAAREVGAGEPLVCVVCVTEAFNNLTDLTIALQEATDAAFTTPKTLLSVKPALADLTLGAIFRIPVPPGANLEFLSAYYTPSGTAPSTGKVTTFFALACAVPRNAAI